MKKLFFTTLFILVCTALSAQNTISQYGQGMSATGMDGNRYDRNGNPIDTTAVIDASTVPVGLNAWKIDTRFGEMTPVPVDTLQHGFQNSNMTGKFIYSSFKLNSVIRFRNIFRMDKIGSSLVTIFRINTHMALP